MKLCKIGNFLILVCLMIVESGHLMAESNKKVIDDDDYVQTFVDSLPDASFVKYRDGQVKLWAKMSDRERAGWIVGTVLPAAVGLTFLGGATLIREDGLRLFFAFHGALMVLCGSTVAAFWAKRAEKENKRFPLLVLDEEGIVWLRSKKVLWQDINDITFLANDFFNAYGTKVDEIRVLSFLDKYNNVVLQVTHSDMLPVSVDNVCALAKHFFNDYKKKAELQTGAAGR